MAYTTIDKPDEYFNTKLYTGNGSATHAITGVGFQPDFVWIKDRVEVYDHHLFDAVRGGGNSLYSNDSVAENTYTTDISFNSDGFTTAGVGSGAINYINQNTHTFASWNWKANGAGVSNTDGTQTAQVSANTTSGFSIVTFAEAASYGGYISFGHGLGVAPNVVIYRQYDNTSNWQVYHSALGTGKLIQLNTTGAASTDTYWGTIDSSVVNVWESLQSPTKNSIAYCFAEKKGFSKFGSYTGNGSTDGTFVYTGFKPAMIIIKRTDSAEQWQISDNKRNTFNVVDKGLFPSGDFVESSSSSYYIDYTSNGFKLRNTATWFNASGGTYIYMAFAEHPFVTSTSIPTTAR
jgi:hypothetical protein